MRKFLMAAVALAAVSTAAHAEITFNPATGTGNVSRSTTVAAFGWSAGQFQDNASGVSFVYRVSSDYQTTCAWTTFEGRRKQTSQVVSGSEVLPINSSLKYDSVNSTIVSGFRLNGYGVASQQPDLPVVGGACTSAEGPRGTYTSVTPLSQTGATLEVVYGGNSVTLL